MCNGALSWWGMIRPLNYSCALLLRAHITAQNEVKTADHPHQLATSQSGVIDMHQMSQQTWPEFHESAHPHQELLVSKWKTNVWIMEHSCVLATCTLLLPASCMHEHLQEARMGRHTARHLRHFLPACS